MSPTLVSLVFILFHLFFGGDVTLSARPDLPCIDEGTPGGIEFMTLVGVANVTPLHSRVYDHNVGPPA